MKYYFHIEYFQHVYESAKILGVHIAADGSMKDQCEELLSETRTWAENIRTGFLSRFESRLALISTIAATWSYPLAAATLTRKECDRIMLPAYKIILSKLGTNQKIPKVFRYAAFKHQGLGLPNIYSKQGIAHLKLIINNIPFKNKVGVALLTCIEYCVLELGSACDNLFTLDYKQWHFLLTDCWIKSTWEFTSTNKISLKGQYARPMKATSGDWALMDAVMDSPNGLFSKAEILNINRCRIFKKCFFISDLCYSDGVKLHPEIASHLPISDRRTQLKYPYQGAPSSAAWDAWNKAIRYCWSHSPAQYTRLATSISPWKPICDMTWKAYYSASLKEIFVKESNRWSRFVHERTEHSRLIYIFSSLVSDIPVPVRGVTLLAFRNTNVIETSLPICYEAEQRLCEESDTLYTPDAAPATDVSFISTKGLESNIAQMLEHCAITDLNKLRSAIRQKTATLVTDGSFHPSLRLRISMANPWLMVIVARQGTKVY